MRRQSTPCLVWASIRVVHTTTGDVLSELEVDCVVEALWLKHCG